MNMYMERPSPPSTLQSEEPKSELALTSIPHPEYHKEHSPSWRDVILGFADGLTVPFALTAGLSSLGSSKLVVLGGLAELFSGAISMGLGGFLASLTDRDHYLNEEKREREEVRDRPEDEKEECMIILEKYGVGRDVVGLFVERLSEDVEMWVQFMMDFELKLESVEVSQALKSAACLGVSYFVGGIIPMIPYFVMKNVTHALFVSIGITVAVLLIFGFAKNWITIGTKRASFYGAAQTLVKGVLAAGASYGIVRALDSRDPVETR